MKIPAVTVALLAVLLVSCVTPHPTETVGRSAGERISSEITPEVISQLSVLLSQNPDLREAYLIAAPQASGYALIPVFDSAPNMISLYEAVDLFKSLVPGSPMNLALLTTASRKQMVGASEPFYVHP